MNYMVRNEEKYKQALQFRARGFTLEEIAKICDVSKSTVSKWLKNNSISESVTKQNKNRAGQENAKRLKLVNKARTGERALRYKEILKSAETEFKHYKTNPLFVAGLMLYAASGDLVDGRTIRLSTSRFTPHKLFISFAVDFLGVSKSSINFWILLRNSKDEEVVMRKWKSVTTLPYSQFYKNQVIKSQTKKQTLHFGVGNTIIGSTVLKRKLIRWIELMQKELSK
jgi:predicted transcriptional regulator